MSFDQLSFLRSHSVLAVDWESGAIAKICALNQVRCCIIRGITDTVLGVSSEDIDEQRSHYRVNTPLVMGKCLITLLPKLILQLSSVE